MPLSDIANAEQGDITKELGQAFRERGQWVLTFLLWKPEEKTHPSISSKIEAGKQLLAEVGSEYCI